MVNRTTIEAVGKLHLNCLKFLNFGAMSNVNAHHTCLNCQHSLPVGDRFCGKCGQESRETGESLASFFKHFLSDYFTFDSKIGRSFLPLLSKPGFLTAEFLAGRRVRYIPPLRLYIFISIVFFLVLGFEGRERGDMNEEALFWDRFFEVHLPRIFFLLLPMFALILQLLNIRSKRNGYVRHFVFALHLHAFAFVAALVYIALSELLIKVNLQVVNPYLGILFGVYLLGYLHMAIRRVYGRNRWKSLFRVLLLLLIYGLAMSGVIVLALVVLSA